MMVEQVSVITITEGCANDAGGESAKRSVWAGRVGSVSLNFRGYYISSIIVG